MNRRRTLAALLAIGAAPLAARAQTKGKPLRIGVLALTAPERGQAMPSPFLLKLAALGWFDGQNCLIEPRNAEGHVDRLDALAAGHVREAADVIVAIGPQAAVAAAKATRTIPIVFAAVNFPVELGLAASLARPGGNLTGGTWTTGPEFYTKLLEFARAIAPKATRIAGLSSPSALTDVSGRVFDMRPVLQSAASRLGMELQGFRVLNPEDFQPAFAGIVKWRAHALVVPGDPVTYPERKRIIDFANKNRLPGIYAAKDFAVDGGLLSYSADINDMQQLAAVYVDRVLRGAKPASLPIEQPTKFELVINLKIARALGIKLPQSLLLRADRVIE